MPTFPALDEEPPPRSVASRLARGALVLVLLAGVGAGVWGVRSAVSGSGSASGSASASTSGQVLVLTEARTLVEAAPDGTHLRPLAGFGGMGGGQGVVAPDGRVLVTDAGDTVSLQGGRPLAHSTALYPAMSHLGQDCSAGYCQALSGIVDSAQPFADGGRSVVFSVLDYTGTGPVPPARIELVATAGGDPRSLGSGDAYAADPTGPAAFVATRARPNGGDASIELRTAGGAHSTVVTAQQVTRDLGRPGPAPSLVPHPDPTGQRLAVTADDPASGAVLGLLVYTRSGRLVARAAEPPTGPVSWSPSGGQLLYRAASGAVLWTPGQVSTSIALPATAALLESCVWSPDGHAALCLGYPGPRQHYDAWVRLDLVARTVRTSPALGVPLLWTR